jgi:hypothetical protein
MILDSLLKLSDGQDCSQGTGNIYSENVLNTGTTTGDIAAGEQLVAIIVIDEAFTSSGSTATVQFHVIDELNTTLDDQSVIIVETRAIVVTVLTLGKIIILPIPVGLVTQQYLGLRYTIGGETTATGTVTAYIGPANFAQTWNV